ncbi:hypothetical protein ABFS82_03G085600 [Erythranthe guttata]|nr:PREDICTED: uncharacterized protein LOC105950646 [Erythranthe guttata]|eukprot:XP_012829467.1 PREDICTED: uncharacterized protein LOC105950646 [Erythranthe guttata]
MGYLFNPSTFFIFFSLVTLQLLQFCHSATMVVDGVSVWNHPKVQIGDSVIFQHKNQYRLYIFRNEKAFNVCNFTQATLLTKPNSTSYTWRISRAGFFYFAFNNGSNEACLHGQKLAVEVVPLAPPPHQSSASPELPPSVEATPPTSGGTVASSPAFPWPFQPRESGWPSLAPGLSPVSPDKEGIPFINSNPAVPLPTGEVDSATIRPLPTSGYQHSREVVGFCGFHRGLISVILLLIMI